MKNRIAMLTGSIYGTRDGVGDYSNRLFDEINNFSNDEIKLDLHHYTDKGLFSWIKYFKQYLGKYKIIHMQYPCEGWGNSIAPGIIPPLMKLFYSNNKIIVTLHEWSSAHLLRKASIIPLLVIADVIIVVSPREKVALDILLNRFGHSKVKIVPLANMLEIPALNGEIICKRRKELKVDLQVDNLIGYFGFIYPWKQVDKLLEVIKSLNEKGISTGLVLAGDFPEDHKKQRQQFLQNIENMQLKDRVLFLGYIDDPFLLAYTLAATDIVALLFKDGLTARRSSFWYCLQLGLKILTTFPTSNHEFEGILDFDLCTTQIVLVQPDASSERIIKEIKLDSNNYYLPIKRDIGLNWSDIANSHINIYTNYD